MWDAIRVILSDSDGYKIADEAAPRVTLRFRGSYEFAAMVKALRWAADQLEHEARFNHDEWLAAKEAEKRRTRYDSEVEKRQRVFGLDE